MRRGGVALIGLCIALLAPRVTESQPVPRTLFAMIQHERLQACLNIGNKLGSVSSAECLKSGLEHSWAWSVDGAPVLLREYPPPPSARTSRPSSADRRNSR